MSSRSVNVMSTSPLRMRAISPESTPKAAAKSSCVTPAERAAARSWGNTLAAARVFAMVLRRQPPPTRPGDQRSSGSLRSCHAPSLLASRIVRYAKLTRLPLIDAAYSLADCGILLAASTFTAAGVSSFRIRAPTSAVYSGRGSKVMGCLPDARHSMGHAGAKGDICFSLPVVRQRYQPHGRQGIAPRARNRPRAAYLVWRDSQSSASPSSRPQPHQHDQSHKHHRPHHNQRLPSQQLPTSPPPDSPATKTPSRRISRRAAPEFTWVMFRVGHLWWTSVESSRTLARP